MDLSFLLTLVGLVVVAAAVLSVLKARLDRTRMTNELADIEWQLARSAEVLEKTPVGYLQTDREGVVLRVNKAECAFRGLRREELLGKRLWELDAPAEQDKTRDRFSEALKSDEPVNFRRKYERRGAGDAIVDIQLCQLREGGGATGVLGVSIDTSDRAEAEEQALQTSGELRAIFSAFPDAFLRLDPSGRILDYKTSAASRFELPSKGSVGQQLQSVLPGDGGPLVGKAIAELQRNRTTSSAEFRIDGEEGGHDWFEVRLAPINWNETLALVRNITAKKQAEEQAEHAAFELQAKNQELADALVTAREATRLKNRFLANMSHEIRTPINGVMGMIELLLDTHLNEEQRDYSEAAKQSADRLLKVVSDVLDISTIEAGKLSFEPVSFDLRDLIERLSASYSPLAARKGLTLDARIHSDIPRVVKGDPNRLQQVLSNLLDNAIKFTETGRVSVRVEQMAVDQDSQTLRFLVEDTGPGITEQGLPSLFESFVQGDGSTTRKHGGTGLGLAISKHLVQMMGGEIGVDSQPGQGSTFSFTAVFEKPGADVLPEGDAPAGLHNVRVLVAEYDEASRALLRQHLSFWGCRHLEVSSGKRVSNELRQAALEGHPFRLALLSLDMPDEDGVSIAHVIKSDPVIQNTLLVAVVPTSMRGDGAALRAIGFSSYVQKPVRPGDLYETLLEQIQADDPAVARPRLPVRRPGDPLKLTRHPTRILLAEDDAINQKLVLRILEKAGIEADAVFDGRRAVEAATQKEYDVVLMDVQMPKMDGLEATAQIRFREGTGRHTPILALTANAMPGDRERCLAAGMDDYLSKPVSLEALQDAIQRWLPQDTADRPTPAG